MSRKDSQTATVPDPAPDGGGGSPTFPGRSQLPANSSWPTAVLVATGGSLMIVVTLGAEVADLGNWAIWVWVATAAIGGIQCLLIAELAARFPERAGGTAQYAYRVRPQGSQTLGALSAWCYWFAWTPGIAVNLILAGTFLSNQFLTGVEPVVLAFIIGAILYTVTAMGLRLTTVVHATLAVAAVAVVAFVALGPALKPQAFDGSQILPAVMPSEAGDGLDDKLAVIAKWAFVATWSSYAAELASTVASEIKHAGRMMPRVMSISAIICFIAFSAVPVALFGLVGVDGIQQAPFDVFANAGNALLGPAGEAFVVIGLSAVLILAAETFIIGSSRTIYQMAQDGHIPAIFAKVNKRGAPIGSIAWDAVVIGIMLLVFGTDVVSVVASANFGYLIVFVLMPIAYLVLRRNPAGRPDSLRLGKPFVAVAWALFAANLVLLVYGGIQWGAKVVFVGIAISLLIVPIAFATRRLRARRELSEASEAQASRVA